MKSFGISICTLFAFLLCLSIPQLYGQDDLVFKKKPFGGSSLYYQNKKLQTYQIEKLMLNDQKSLRLFEKSRKQKTLGTLLTISGIGGLTAMSIGNRNSGENYFSNKKMLGLNFGSIVVSGFGIYLSTKSNGLRTDAITSHLINRNIDFDRRDNEADTVESEDNNVVYSLKNMILRKNGVKLKKKKELIEELSRYPGVLKAYKKGSTIATIGNLATTVALSLNLRNNLNYDNRNGTMDKISAGLVAVGLTSSIYGILKVKKSYKDFLQMANSTDHEYGMIQEPNVRYLTIGMQNNGFGFSYVF